MDGTICNVWERNAVIFSRSCSTMIDYFGINGTITCIVTLFLAEFGAPPPASAAATAAQRREAAGVKAQNCQKKGANP